MTKCCKLCLTEKIQALFVKDPSYKHGYKPVCKDCYARKRREWRKQPENRTRSREYGKRSRIKSKERRGTLKKTESYAQKRSFIDSHKEAGCIRCGELDICCLSFHHRREEEKSFTISRFTGRTISELSFEISKCVVLCENCHRKLHSGRWVLE